MIEVVPVGNRWTWRMLCPFGRVLVYVPDSYPTDTAANDAAKIYRAGLLAVADAVDHRQARCI